MKNIKKALFLGVFFIAGISAKTTDTVYEKKVKQIVHYNLIIPKNMKIKPPFYISDMKKQNQSFKAEIKTEYQIIPLSILLNSVYLKVKIYKGDSLVKEEKIWVKKNEKIGNCILSDIKNKYIILKCNNKYIKKNLNSDSNIFKNLKERN